LPLIAGKQGGKSGNKSRSQRSSGDQVVDNICELVGGKKASFAALVPNARVISIELTRLKTWFSTITSMIDPAARAIWRLAD
jgi:hypothetical protein